MKQTFRQIKLKIFTNNSTSRKKNLKDHFMKKEKSLRRKSSEEK